jgi:hypothetical protein
VTSVDRLQFCWFSMKNCFLFLICAVLIIKCGRKSSDLCGFIVILLIFNEKLIFYLICAMSFPLSSDLSIFLVASGSVFTGLGLLFRFVHLGHWPDYIRRVLIRARRFPNPCKSWRIPFSRISFSRASLSCSQQRGASQI